MNDNKESGRCSVPDCDYAAEEFTNSDKCYAHTRGKNPIMTCEQYMAQQTEVPFKDWRNSLGEYINR